MNTCQWVSCWTTPEVRFRPYCPRINCTVPRACHADLSCRDGAVGGKPRQSSLRDIGGWFHGSRMPSRLNVCLIYKVVLVQTVMLLIKVRRQRKSQTRVSEYFVTSLMPRPRLYHTPEEKQAANRAKSQRHYHKCVSYAFIESTINNSIHRHKSDIQLQRQATYKKKSKR